MPSGSSGIVTEHTNLQDSKVLPNFLKSDLNQIPMATKMLVAGDLVNPQQINPTNPEFNPVVSPVSSNPSPVQTTPIYNPTPIHHATSIQHQSDINQTATYHQSDINPPAYTSIKHADTHGGDLVMNLDFPAESYLDSIPRGQVSMATDQHIVTDQHSSFASNQQSSNLETIPNVPKETKVNIQNTQINTHVNTHNTHFTTHNRHPTLTTIDSETLAPLVRPNIPSPVTITTSDSPPIATEAQHSMVAMQTIPTYKSIPMETESLMDSSGNITAMALVAREPDPPRMEGVVSHGQHSVERHVRQPPAYKMEMFSPGHMDLPLSSNLNLPTSSKLLNFSHTMSGGIPVTNASNIAQPRPHSIELNDPAYNVESGKLKAHMAATMSRYLGPPDQGVLSVTHSNPHSLTVTSPGDVILHGSQLTSDSSTNQTQDLGNIHLLSPEEKELPTHHPWS